MKRVLILTDGFAAPAYVPRVRFLVKALVKRGYEVDILTEHIATDPAMPAIGCPVYEVKYLTQEGSLKKAEWLAKFLLQLATPHKDKQLIKEGKKLLAQHSYDVVFCSCFHTFPLHAAEVLAEMAGVPLVVDLRDIEEQCPGGGYLAHKAPALLGMDRAIRGLHSRVNRNRRNRVLRSATAVTTVSEWHQELLSQYNKNTFLIYNGYDADLFTPKDVLTDKFRIGYTGRLYQQVMQDPTLFFEALALLLQQGGVDAEKVETVFYTNEASRRQLEEYAQQFGVTHLVTFLDYVPTHHVPEVLQHCSILLVFSNKAHADGANGIMTTKLYEAMGVEKPVLCVRSDESLLQQIIQETQCGIAATEVQEVANFIEYYYHQWQAQGYTRNSCHREQIAHYSRQQQSQRLIDILEHVCQ